jgi:sugar lactone lactonase YvrE
VLLINGHEPDFMMAQSAATFDRGHVRRQELQSLHKLELGCAIERDHEMKSLIALGVIAGSAAAVVFAQSPSTSLSPSSSFPRGSSMQSWQNPGIKDVLAKCKNPPKPFGIPIAKNANAAPPDPVLPATVAIPGVLAAGQSWKVVWSWEGNNVDGPIAGDNGTVLFANNDASNVMQMDPATGLARILYSNTNTGGAVSRSRNGALFVAERGLGSAVEQLEPQRKMLANSFHGEPLECVGGVINDLMADARGGVYFSVTGATDSGVFYADSKGVVSQYGKDVPLANGIILSPDEKTLYVTNGATVYAFDVKTDGSLANQREFGKLRGGEGGDGSAVDQQGRVYIATGKSVDVFTPDGKFAGSIPGPQGLHGTFFGGRDRKTLFGIVFYGGWGTPSARNRIIAIPTIAQGYTGRAK